MIMYKNKKLTNEFWQSKYHALSVRGWEVASKRRKNFFRDMISHPLYGKGVEKTPFLCERVFLYIKGE